VRLGEVVFAEYDVEGSHQYPIWPCLKKSGNVGDFFFSNDKAKEDDDFADERLCAVLPDTL